jgi:hypothetical protein
MTIGAACGALAAALSCAALRPGLIGHDALRTGAVEMKVGGRIDGAFNKTVVFGPFHTGTFSTGSAKVNYDRPQQRLAFGYDIARYMNASQNFSFTQYDSSGDSMSVQCFAARATRSAQYGIISDDSSSDRYELLISKTNDKKTVLIYKKGTPLTVSFDKDTVTMTDENKYDKQGKTAFEGILFTKSGETVAAVNLMNEGLVWIEKDLDDRCKLLIAAISTAMLVKPNLENLSPR